MPTIAFALLLTKTVSFDSPENEETQTWLGDSWYVEYGNRDNTFSLMTPKKIGKAKENLLKGVNLDHILVKMKSNKTPEIRTVLKSSVYDARPEGRGLPRR